MLKKMAVLLGLVLVAGISFAEEGRWFLSTDKKSGKEVALLQTWSKKVLKVLPLEQGRAYSPVPYDVIVDQKQKKRAMRAGTKFTQLTAKNSSATLIDGGRCLILQEQTIVMPPQLEGQAGLDYKKGELLEPEDNAILVTLFDDSGRALWSRKFGPLAGRLPTNREAWALSGSPDAPPAEEKLPESKK